jgi:hypothetical protein
MDTHLQCVWSCAVAQRENAGSVYLKDSMVACSNKSSTLGGYSFIIFSPKHLHTCCLEGHFAKLERKKQNYPSIESLSFNLWKKVNVCVAKIF